MSAPPILALRDISVRLGGSRGFLRKTVPPVQAVRSVSLELRQGEILSLVGESGCGKTTLGRTILGLQRESGGEIDLDGRLVGGLSPEAARRARRAIQYVHQDAGAALDPWWSIGRTLEEGLLIHGVGDRAERRERVAAMLSAVGLDPAWGRRYPHEFSGGQLRRVALARILLLQPRILILDEPTSGLDMSVQATVLNLLLDLRQTILPHLPVHFPRSVRRRASLGSGGDHVSRADRRDGARPDPVRRAHPSLYADAARGGSAIERPAGGRAGCRARRSAEPDTGVARLRLRRSLSHCRSGLSCRRASTGSGRAGPRRRLPSGAGRAVCLYPSKAPRLNARASRLFSGI